MSEHAWFLEALESYAAGGLDPEACAEMEEHLAECPECSAALEEIRAVDHQLASLFVPVRPNPALEDRSIQALRQVLQRPGGRRFTGMGKLGLAVAAAVLLAIVGGSLSLVLEEPSPNQGPVALNHLKQHGIDLHDSNDALRRLPAAYGQKESAAKVDLSGGTILTFQVESSPGLPPSPEQLAESFRETLEARLIHGKVHHGLNYKASSYSTLRDGTHSEGEKDPLRVTDIDPAAIEPDTDIKYNNDRKADVSVPGLVRPDEPVGMEKGPMQTPPLPLPLPSGVGGGTGGAVTSTAGDSFYGRSGASKEEPRAFTDGTSNTVTFATRYGKQKSPAHGPATSSSTYFKPGDAFSQNLKEAGEKKATDDKDTEEEERAKKTPPAKHEPAKSEPGKEAGTPPAEAPAAAAQRKIIRSGDVDFEVDSFDAAVAVITRLLTTTRGFIDTVNSNKLPNGKMCGAVVVRVPPEQLDNFLLEMRKDLGKFGELKGQRIGSKDITKQYIDLESRLRGARTMEERLLRIIKEGKGDIKDLLQAEKQLGSTRTTIEELEGELRYYANLVSLSTITINLTEKEIRAAAVIAESERVQAGIEVEDVETARRTVLDAVNEAKGRVTKDEMKQHAAGAFNAILHFEVEPTAAGPVRDALKQLGNVVRLEIDRVQTAEGGTMTPNKGKVQRGPTQFLVSVYNLANVAPRETQTLVLAAADVPAAFNKLREALAKTKGRIRDAQLNEQDRQKITATLDFDVRRADEPALQAALAEVGEVLSRQVVRGKEGENVTDAKVGFNVALVMAANIEPRERITLAEEVNDVEQALTVMTAQVKEAQGRIYKGPGRAQERNGRVTAQVEFEVPLSAAAGLVEKLKTVGQVRYTKVDPNPKAPEGRLALARIEVLLSNSELLVPGDEGLWSQVRNGLSFSLRALSFSVGWLVIGLLVVLPWALLVYAILVVLRRLFRSSPPPPEPGPAAQGS